MEEAEVKQETADPAEEVQPDYTEGLSPEEAAVAVKILPRLAEEANRQARAAKAKEMARELQILMDENKKRIEEVLEDIRKANTPLSPDEVSKLLSQEYMEFRMPIGTNGDKRDFVIRELPIRAEKRLLKTIKNVLVAQMKDLARVDWTTGTTGLEKLSAVIDIVPGALEALADCVAVCLDPNGDDPKITGEWVQTHIGANRLLNLVNAQVQASRYRDFFSLAYRMYQQQKTTT